MLLFVRHETFLSLPPYPESPPFRPIPQHPSLIVDLSMSRGSPPIDVLYIAGSTLHGSLPRLCCVQLAGDPLDADALVAYF
eukprot:1740375-Prymnesium_polylepis.1